MGDPSQILEVTLRSSPYSIQTTQQLTSSPSAGETPGGYEGLRDFNKTKSDHENDYPIYLFAI